MIIRKRIQLISLLLFPITMYYFSPYVIMMGLSEQIITGSFVLFFGLMLVSVFSSHLFCSTLCPVGALQDIMITHKRKPIKSLKLGISKWVVFFIWFAALVMIIFNFGMPKEVDVFYQTDHGISISQSFGYIIYYAVLGIFMILALTFGNRGGCHTVCWMAPFMIIGSRIGRWLHLPYWGLSSKQGCINCSQCSKACPMSLDVNQMVQENKTYNTNCISCKECVQACPKKILEIKWKKA